MPRYPPRALKIGTDSAARFLVVGVANTLVYSGLLYLFLAHFALSSAVAVTLCFVITIPLHFLLNRGYVFKAGDGRMTGQAARYAISTGVSYVAALLVVWFCTQVLQLAPLPTVLANAVTAALVGYTLSATWVFR